MQRIKLQSSCDGTMISIACGQAPVACMNRSHPHTSQPTPLFHSKCWERGHRCCPTPVLFFIVVVESSLDFGYQYQRPSSKTVQVASQIVESALTAISPVIAHEVYTRFCLGGQILAAQMFPKTPGNGRVMPPKVQAGIRRSVSPDVSRRGITKQSRSRALAHSGGSVADGVRWKFSMTSEQLHSSQDTNLWLVEVPKRAR